MLKRGCFMLFPAILQAMSIAASKKMASMALSLDSARLLDLPVLVRAQRVWRCQSGSNS